MKQKILGQFFTKKNVFKNTVFLDWFKSIENSSNKTILEPFAGKNGLIDMLEELNLISSYQSFDIEPQQEKVQYNDSILSFPKGFNICITNPPFLAKNVASRKNIPVLIEPFSDLYEKCLDLCLKNCEYVAAIVPESFIVSPFFKSRLFAVISLTEKSLFQHTEHPVCLALFNTQKTDDFLVYKDEQFLGKYNEKLNEINSWLKSKEDLNIVFHDKGGELGLFNIDATSIEKMMHFGLGNLIDPKDVGYHARLRTRIKILSPNSKPLTKKQLESFIKTCNKTLKEYRDLTNDIFLTSFKGLRSDGMYRRRLDYATARLIVAKAYTVHFKNSN
jgi:hypothetical protein